MTMVASFKVPHVLIVFPHAIGISHCRHSALSLILGAEKEKNSFRPRLGCQETNVYSGRGARHSYEIKWISSLLSSAGSYRVIRFWLNLHYLYVERGSGDYLSS